MKKLLRLVGPVLLILAVGLFMGVSTYFVVKDTEGDKVRYRFERDVGDEIEFLTNNIKSDLSITGVLESLFYASDFVSREEFRVFSRDFLAKQKSLHAISWIPRVTRSQKASFVEAARTDGLTEFRISQRSDQGKMIPDIVRDEYFPVYYIEPAKGNEVAVGFNLASNERRRIALNEARDSGEKFATARITLIQETGNQAAILVFDPVYEGGTVPASVAERREKLKGYISAVVRVDSMVEGHSRPDTTQLQLQISDISNIANKEKLYQQKNLARSNGSLKIVRTINVAGRSWEMAFRPRQGSYVSNVGTFSFLVLVFPMLFTAALAAYLYQVLGTREHIREQVELKTRELTASEDSLEALVDDLKRANEELKRFAYVASHDLQEPLRKLQQFTEFLENDCGDEISGDGKYFLEVISDSSRRMSQLIKDLLSYSRMQNRDFQPEEVSLAEIIDGILLDYDVLISETDASIQVGALPTIRADQTAVAQLLRNLIGNALKYRHSDRQPEVRISCPPLNYDGHTEFKIVDNGIGFEMKYAERIMQPFQRLHNKSEYSGTGIGLALCKSICERHRWKLDADSVPGEGSTFTITINTDDANKSLSCSDGID